MAIVLRTTPFQDGEGLVVSFLSEYGERLVGLAKAAKRPASKWVANFEPLSLVNLNLFGKEQNNVRRITKCELVHSPLILGQLESSLVIACLADTFDRVAKVGIEDARLFRLLSVCSRTLMAQPDRAMAVLAYSEHWLLHCLGLMPHPRLCGRCGNDIEPLVQFAEEYGWCCAGCTPLAKQLAFPLGIREHLRLLRTCSASDAPDPNRSDAAKTTTRILRKRLQQELGSTKSYAVMEQVLVFANEDK